MMSSNEFVLGRPAALQEGGASRPAPALARAASAGRERVAGLDVLRLAALSAIVWFHSGAPGHEYMAWRLPALAILSASLAAGRDEPRPLAVQARKSASRLLVPWLFWCGVYGVVELATYLRHGVSIVDELGARAWLTGPSVHLWYLPYAFTMVLSLNAARRLTDRLRPAHACLLATLLAIASLAALSIDKPYQGDEGTPGPQWLRCLPAAFLGLAIGTAGRHEGLRRPGMIAVVAAVTTACTLLATLMRDDLAARYGLAMLLVALASTWRFEPPRWLAEAAGLGMGVYLVHMAVHRIVYASSNRLPTPDLSSPGHAVAVILLSFAAAWALARTPLRRFL